MSRIRGIETRVQTVQNDPVPVRRNGLVENTKKKNEDRASSDDVEKQQMLELVRKLPALGSHFEVHRKIGEGTFSSVYLGSLRREAAVPAAGRRWFAIKHLVPTAHPHRIEHELKCLQDMGGKDNIIGVELCLRHFDTIVFVMPYIPHRKFSEYVGDMTAGELRDYLRALLVALRRVHSFGVIHRDVKPSNFLYDRESKRYLLVDFGLAQRIPGAAAERDTRVSVALPPAAPPPAPAAAPSAPPPAHHHALKRTRGDEDISPPAAKRVALDLTVGPKSKLTPAPAPAPAPARAAAPHTPHTPHTPLAQPQAALPTKPGAGAAACACWGRGAVCATCCARAAPRACRAGTCGFRPPEVLLKCPNQGTAVDMWAAGVVVASVLSARYPFFRAGDDAAALAELSDLLGTQPLQRAAASLGRRLLTSRHRRGLCLRKLCARLRAPPAPPAAPPAPACAHCRLPQPACLCRDPAVPAHYFTAGRTVAGFPDSAFALAARLLQPDPAQRITADQALQHAFFTDAEP